MFRVAGTVLCLLMLVGGLATAATASPRNVVDARTRGFASIASICVQRADEIWHTAPATIQAEPARYFLHVEDAVARCTVDYRALVRLDRSGVWSSFEGSAQLGIAGVQSWARGANELLLALKSTSQTTGKQHLGTAETETTHAVRLWRRCVTGLNAARRRVGLRPFTTAP